MGGRRGGAHRRLSFARRYRTGPTRLGQARRRTPQLRDRLRCGASHRSGSVRLAAHRLFESVRQNETALDERGALIATLETLPTASLDLLANIHSWRGVLFYHLGQYEAALTAVQRAQQLGQQVGDVAFVAGELGNWGMIYMNLGDLDRAVTAYQQAAAELKNFKAMGQYINVLGTLGAVYLLRGELSTALRCVDEQLTLAESLHYARETARAQQSWRDSDVSRSLCRELT